MKRLISACTAITLCFGTISAKTFLVDSHLSAVSDETLATHNQDGGTYALYKGKYYRIGVTGFRSLNEFASNATSCGATSGDTLYVAPGKYTEDATIKVAGLTNILTGSLSMSDKEADTSNGDQLGREDNPSRPNIWEQGW
jgi:hypothetical protein